MATATTIGLFAGLFQDAIRPFLATFFPPEAEVVELSLIENDPRFHVDPSYDTESEIVSGISNRFTGFQIDNTTGERSHGQSFEFLLYAQPTDLVRKEPIIVEEISLVVDHAEPDVIYTFPHGPRELTHYHDFSVQLKPGQNRYLISDSQYKLQEGDSDSFRVKLSSSEYYRYVLHVEVVWWKPSSPAERHVFQSRQYTVAFPEIRLFSSLLSNKTLSAGHVSADELYGLFAYSNWSPEQTHQLRLVIPGYHYYFRERRGAGSSFFNALNATNPFFRWWAENSNALVVPGSYSMEYGQGPVGEPKFSESYFIFSDGSALLRNRGDNGTLYESGSELRTISEHFEAQWQAGTSTATEIQTIDDYIEILERSINSGMFDKEVIDRTVFFPIPLTANFLIRASAFGSPEEREQAIQNLGTIGLSHRSGQMIRNLHPYLQELYNDSTDFEIKTAIAAVLGRYDLPVE